MASSAGHAAVGTAAALAPADAALLARLQPATPTAYHRLNPLTKAVIATVTTLAVFALGGYLAPALLLAALVAPGAVVARAVWRVTTTSLAVTLPLAVAVALVSVFTRAGTTVLFRVGPFDATLEGVDFASQVIVRLFVMATALTLFGLTTAPRAFIADLERRGLSPRLAFAVGAVLDAVPSMVERARTVRDAQRARGLDTQGHLLRRIAAVVPLIGPVVIGSLHQVEARSLALDARAFGRPGLRHLLWAPGDTRGQRLARWLLIAGLVVGAAGTITGVIPRLP